MKNGAIGRGSQPTIIARHSTRHPRIVTIHLLGRMRVLASDGTNILPHSRKARALLAYLCFCDRTRASRNRLTGLLWGNSSEPQARMSLRHALLELNRDVNAKVPGLIEIDRETVGLNTRACWIDIQAEPDRTEQLLTDLDGVSVDV